MQTFSVDHLTDEELLRLVDQRAHTSGLDTYLQQALVRRFAALLGVVVDQTEPYSEQP